jgi:nucleotide-binding universal stress UspA family protein
MRVLIAVDGAKSRDIPAMASKRPWPKNSSFCLLHIFVPVPFTAAPSIQKRKLENVAGNVEAAVKPLREVGWDTMVEIHSGSPRRDVSRFAANWGADLVMVGCNEMSDLTRMFLGSTSQSLLRHAPCSVEIVRGHVPEAERYRTAGMRILVATDGSDGSLAAVRSIADRPWPPESTVKVVSVPEFILMKDPSYLESHEVKDLGAAAIEEARRSISVGLEALAGSSLKVTSEVPELEERPHKVILHEADAWKADMIVVGSYGRSGFDRFVMGSVSEAVALHASCSVEVVRSISTPH